MRVQLAIRALLLASVLSTLALPGGAVLGHGGVVEEDDACLIRISYLKAHFKVYQPRSAGHTEYCEDLPEPAESVFVMEYLHDEMGRVPLEFRIIENVTGKGRFARWEDIAAIDDIEAVTVFYREPAIEPHVFTAVHEFEAAGSYIGIVTARPDTGDRRHVAVFPFDVGYTGAGVWPWVVGAVILVQLQYLWMSGRLRRWLTARRIGEPSLKVVPGGKDED
ncbi:MAG: hypothetical protein R3176_07510 [Woeseiaceae bacterium]|nr:hypothetical protein [Woeseiaceae bacterium]